MKRSFTLIEFFTIMVIFAILVAILLPLLAKAREMQQHPEGNNSLVIKPETYTVGNDQFTVHKIGGCEYLFFSTPESYDFAFTHKGNCNNPIHKYNVEHQ